MHAWPLAMGHGSGDKDPETPLEYHDTTTSSLAERCATAASEWGTDKVAAQVQPSALYKDPDAHPLVLLLMVLDRYGPDSMDWDPEVLRATLMRDAYVVSGANWTKLMAARVLIMSPSPWRQWEVFHWTARGLAGLPPNFSFLEQPELGHLFVCADLATIIDPKRETAVEVDKFVAASLRAGGHVYAPESLSFAQRELEDPQLECRSCRALFTDNNDQKCVSCASAGTLQKVPYAYAALRDEVRTMFDARKALPFERAVADVPETPAGNLVYGLCVHWDHAQQVRRRLLAQLRLLAR